MATSVLDATPGDSLLLASYVRYRRQQLELTVADAAHLAGLQFSQWCALESGWIPDHGATLRALSQTLLANSKDVSRLAEVSRSAKTTFPEDKQQ